MHKPISIISLSLIAALICCGCAGQDETPVLAVTNDTTAEETTVKPELEVKDFGGYDFNILVHTQGTPGSWHQHLDFGWSEEAAGDLINDAVYTRNLIIEERYNVTINSIEADDPYNMGKNAILAGTNEYDVIMPYIDQSFTLAEEGLLVDFNELDGLDITNSWWDQAIKRDLSLRGRLYVLTGDISMADEELNYGVYFNKGLIDEYSLDDPYQLVRDNKWTIDQLHSMAKAVTHDLNGDSVVDENDMYGVLTDFGVAPVWFFALGGQMAGIKDDGTPEILLGSERASDIMDKLSGFFNDAEAVLNESQTKGSWAGFDQMLITNRALFRAGSIYDMPFYRDMENDFGVLPYPKLKSEQEDYYHIIATQVCAGVCVPVGGEDLARTGLLLEALASESRDTVTKAYYDINLYKKLTRDSESGEMLDIIFATKRYDLAKTFAWGGLEDVIRNGVKSGQSFASLLAAAESRANAEMMQSYELFE